MAAPSAQTLQNLAGETGYQAGTLEKVLRLLDLLQEIALSPRGVSGRLSAYFVALCWPRRELAPMTRVGPLAWLWSGAPCRGGRAPFWLV
jgi:hypothetical protein